MQKNKLVHEDIKAVCSSAAKKLVALGLAVAVGGTNFSLTAGAQTPEELARIEAMLARSYKYDLALGLPEDTAQENRKRYRLYLMSTPSVIDNFEAFIDGEIDNQLSVARARAREREREREREIESALEIVRTEREAKESRERTESEQERAARKVSEWAERETQKKGWLEIRLMQLKALQRAFRPDLEREIERLKIRLAELRARPSAFDPYDFLERENPERRTPNRPAQQNRETGGRQTISGNTMLQVQGTNYIEAWSGTHIHSLSNNALMHEGDGAVDVDRGDIIISDFSNGQTARDVSINDASSVTVAPDIATRIQNGTEFTMGATLQETAENILRALTPNSLRNIINRFTNQD